ncbi:MAG TPA: amino acid ABC transporter substrate-binding protein, partial [Clostridiaceae bacterium]|nr:amino acid ABC transporter substrate-binding protein [Clostridiaceae bacterium]
MKRTEKVLFTIVLLAAVLFTGCSLKGRKSISDKETKSAQGANTLNGIKEKGKFIVGLDDSFPPMGFRDGNGDIVGFDIDLAKEAAKRLGVKVEFKPVDWDGVVLSLKNKDIDVIWNGLTITDERKKEIDFSRVYLKNRQIIVVKNGSSIKSKGDLKGKVVGLQMGSSSENALKNDA